ncbi:MAG: hypothetical protein CMJ31_06810 [Phycisphaerae bacterium]|nr:hypothetical protein [Phycisphaerae bacterium]
MARRGGFGDFRVIFGRGLAILLPSIVTLWLLWQASMFVFVNVAEPINVGIRALLLETSPRIFGTYEDDETPDWYVVTAEELSDLQVPGRNRLTEAELVREVRKRDLRRLWAEHWYLNLAGLLVAILLIYLAGRVFGNYIGRKLYTRLERLIAKIPGFKQVYPHVKQVVDLIFGDNATMKAFREVVLVQYPREGLWTLGLVTGESFSQVREAAGEPVVSIFVPTSPTPMTGFVINAPKSETVKVDMTIDQALRFVITAGVLTPDNVAPDTSPEAGPGAIKLLRANETAEAALRSRRGNGKGRSAPANGPQTPPPDGDGDRGV